MRHQLTYGFLAISLLTLASFCFPSYSNNSTPGEQAVIDMYARWNGKWYKNFAFEQKAIFYKDRKVVKTEVWQEILSSPGNLHIRFDGYDTGNGAVYANDSVYAFKAGVLQSKRRETNFLALLGFDIYFYEPEVTVLKLKELGYDLSKSYRTTHKNIPVVVIGTNDPGDLSSSQFWVDVQRQLVVRAIKNSAGAIRDVHYNNYQQIQNNWVATEMVFTDGKDTVFVEEYFNMSFPKKVRSEVYDPSMFFKSRW